MPWSMNSQLSAVQMLYGHRVVKGISLCCRYNDIKGKRSISNQHINCAGFIENNVLAQNYYKNQPSELDMSI